MDDPKPEEWELFDLVEPIRSSCTASTTIRPTSACSADLRAELDRLSDEVGDVVPGNGAGARRDSGS